jgi:hypothetical protein
MYWIDVVDFAYLVHNSLLIKFCFFKKIIGNHNPYNFFKSINCPSKILSMNNDKDMHKIIYRDLYNKKEKKK